MLVYVLVLRFVAFKYAVLGGFTDVLIHNSGSSLCLSFGDNKSYLSAFIVASSCSPLGHTMLVLLLFFPPPSSYQTAWQVHAALLKRAFHTCCFLISTHFGSFTSSPPASQLSFIFFNHARATTFYLVAFSFTNTICRAIYLSGRKQCVCVCFCSDLTPSMCVSVYGWEITALPEMQKLFQLHLWSGISDWSDIRIEFSSWWIDTSD